MRETARWDFDCQETIEVEPVEHADPKACMDAIYLARGCGREQQYRCEPLPRGPDLCNVGCVAMAEEPAPTPTPTCDASDIVLPPTTAYTLDQWRRCEVEPVEVTVQTEAGPRVLTVSASPAGYVYGGDIVLDTDQMIGGPGRGTGKVPVRALWPGGRVPYVVEPKIVDDPLDPSDLATHIIWAVAHWNTSTSIRLVPVTPTPDAPCGPHDDSCIMFVQSEGCSSRLGRAGGRQPVNVTRACTREGVAHEIGHAVGLDHQQSAEHQNLYVEILWENMDLGAHHNFIWIPDRIDYSPYDYNSLMHYPEGAYSINLKPTLRRKQGTGPMGWMAGLTATDIAAIEAMYGPFAFSYRGELPGRTCISVAEPSDPDSWSDNYFCSRAGGFRWSIHDPIEGMNCVQIEEPADPHTWNDNYLCSERWDKTFSWSYAGPIAGQRCIAFYEPSDPHTWSDNYLCWVDAEPIRAVTLRFADIDDDAFLWIGDPAEPHASVCSARYVDTEGTATCDLTELVQRNGLAHFQRFSIKFLNTLGLHGQGLAEILVDGKVVWSKRKARVIRHAGWFYRVILDIDFVRGQVAVVEEQECDEAFACPN